MLILVGACIGIAAAVGGAWVTAVAMALVIAGQIPVYRRAKDELSARD